MGMVICREPLLVELNHRISKILTPPPVQWFFCLAQARPGKGTLVLFGGEAGNDPIKLKFQQNRYCVGVFSCIAAPMPQHNCIHGRHVLCG
ncbi:hypothetical protein e1116g03.tmp0005 [Eimeria tenella]|uniref:Uncharacterized protein n=1 Tax=Eimeria tenella TaxID=5802 RepID=C8TE32_EIMTE|nr:hypothetical protein e1116g03.tmp0005 [Eimeria tenella]